MGDDARIQVGPSFLCLPDIAHASIVSFSPVGSWGDDSRLRVSEVSRVLYRGRPEVVRAILEGRGGAIQA